MPTRLYMDNAATSFPKPPGMIEAMVDYQKTIGASPGRGAYAEARQAATLMHAARENIVQLINGQSPDHILFTLNTSDALNLAIRGLLRPGDHVITTWMDHNSVLRPLNELVERDGVTQTRVCCDPQSGLVDPQDIAHAIRRETRLIAVVHGSNVTGTLQPIAEIGRLAREHAVPLLVDAAQTCGHCPLDVQRDQIDLLAVAGHKGLLGPLGTGFLYVRPGMEKCMRTIREGGTGSFSESDQQPALMPDRFEPGSHNAIGLIGLAASVRWILDRGVASLWDHEQSLIRAMIQGLTQQEIPGLSWYGPQGLRDRCGVFSVRIDGYEPHGLSSLLEEQFGILTRSGLHCAPLAHQTIGTHALGGTTRLSFGPFVSVQDVRYATDALAQIAQLATAHP